MSETTQGTQMTPATGAAKSYEARAYAAPSASSPLAPTTIRRRAPGPRDVQIEVLFCGVCHSDLHQVRNEWKNTMPTAYPCVPGHEIVGRVTAVGREVRRFKEGDLAAVGCLVDSCRSCAACQDGEEQFCEGARDLHLQLARPASRRRHLRRLLREPRRRRGVRAAGLARARSGRGRAAALRRHHHLLAAAALERPRRTEGRRRRPRRPRAHGREARPRLRRPGRRVHHLARQGGGRGRAWEPTRS